MHQAKKSSHLIRGWKWATILLLLASRSLLCADVTLTGSMAIGAGPEVEGVRYPGGTIIDVLFKNETSQAIRVPLYNLTVSAEKAQQDLNTIVVSIPLSRRIDGTIVPVSESSLGIVEIQPGQGVVVTFKTGIRLNLAVPTKIIFHFDDESARRYKIIAGNLEVTLPAFLPDDLKDGYRPAVLEPGPEVYAEPAGRSGADDALPLK